MSTDSHRKRVETALAGGKPDRPPIAFWRHFPVADQNPMDLAKMTVDFQKRYDFDLVKVTPASSYCLEDWGIRDEWHGNPEGTRTYTRRVINRPEDWRNLQVLNPRYGALGKTLESIKEIRNQLGIDTPIIQTIFNPLAQAKNLAGQEMLIHHLHEHSDDLKAGLQTITDTTLCFIDELKKLGIDGIFYAIQHAQTHILTTEEFCSLSIPDDTRILDFSSDLWLNMTHLHGENIMVDVVEKLPAHVLNWHDRETGINLHQVQLSSHKCVCAGLARDEDMLLGNPEKIQIQLTDAYDQTGGKGWIAGTGCVLMTTTPEINLLTARKFVESLM